MKYFLLFIMAIFISACSTYRIEKTGFSALEFGSEGGFTGHVTSYTLNPDGTLWFHKPIGNDSVIVKKLSKRTVCKIYTKAQKLGVDTVFFKHPGNYSSFLIITKHNISNRIVWGVNGNPVPVEIQSFYDELTNVAKY